MNPLHRNIPFLVVVEASGDAGRSATGFRLLAICERPGHVVAIQPPGGIQRKRFIRTVHLEAILEELKSF